jgi:hypothetical protein
MASTVCLILLLGLVAGIVTTLTGAGGGVLLILSLSLVVGPRAALAVSAPVLLVGNLHRLTLYRRRVDLGVALPLVAGALPGSLLGGALAVSLPPLALRGVFLGVTAYAALRAFGARAWVPPHALLAPAGVLVGGVSATSGGAGLLVSPLLLSSGLTGERYIATSATVALATHVGRLTAYGARGMYSREMLVFAAVSTVTVVLGNLVGDRLRFLVREPRRATLAEHGTLAACALLAVLGVAR